MADLRLVSTDLEATLIECRQKVVLILTLLMSVEAHPSFEGAVRLQHQAGQLQDAFGRLALLIEQREEA